MGLFTKLDQKIIKVFHKLQHAKQDESATIIIEKLNASTNAPEALLTVTEFEYDDRTYDNKQLPPDVKFELRISEAVLVDLADFENASSVRHTTPQGTMRYTIARPSTWWPTGFNRFWRFWLIPMEIVITDTFFVVDDGGNFLVDDAGNSIIWDGI